jgi:prevent-host-death family protein
MPPAVRAVNDTNTRGGAPLAARRVRRGYATRSCAMTSAPPAVLLVDGTGVSSSGTRAFASIRASPRRRRRRSPRTTSSSAMRWPSGYCSRCGPSVLRQRLTSRRRISATRPARAVVCDRAVARCWRLMRVVQGRSAPGDRLGPGRRDERRAGMRPRPTACDVAATLRCMTLHRGEEEVGVRALHDRLSEHLDRVEQGVEIIVTRRGRRVARLSAIGRDEALTELVRRGLVRLPERPRSRRRASVAARGSVSELVAEQRR